MDFSTIPYPGFCGYFSLLFLSVTLWLVVAAQFRLCQTFIIYLCSQCLRHVKAFSHTTLQVLWLSGSIQYGFAQITCGGGLKWI